MKTYLIAIPVLLITLIAGSKSYSQEVSPESLKNTAGGKDSVSAISNEVSTGCRTADNLKVPSAKICYTIAKATGVRITVYDILAREVKTIVNEYQQAGTYETEIDGANLSSGTYYYKIQTGDSTKVKKIVLTK